MNSNGDRYVPDLTAQVEVALREARRMCCRWHLGVLFNLRWRWRRRGMINLAVSRAFVRRRPEVVAAIFVGKEEGRRCGRGRGRATVGRSQVRTKTNICFSFFRHICEPTDGIGLFEASSPLIWTGMSNAEWKQTEVGAWLVTRDDAWRNVAGGVRSSADIWGSQAGRAMLVVERGRKLQHDVAAGEARKIR
jgi:hypothetical protein